jgi:glycosyltransferase involved in cell wall biosynthesis
VPDDAPFLLDVTRLIWRRWKGRLPTGIDRVCLAYLRHFGARSQAVVQHERIRRILDRDASQELFELLEGPPERFRSGLLHGILRHLRGLNGKGQERLYLNVGHTGLNSAGFRDWASRSQVRPIYLVHDLIPITHPQFCRPGEAAHHRERMRTVLTTASGVIGNSRATLDELASFAERESLSMAPSLAAWLGTDGSQHLRPSTEPARPTFVTLGTIEGRKNHLLLLDVWSHLVEQWGSKAPQLLIVGQRGWEAERVFETLDGNERLRGHVIELNECSDEELSEHLASARALLFPSLAEGYGLPLIEALGAGIPAIASDLPVFREICSDIPTYLNPLDTSAWEAAILDYARLDSVARARQVKRIGSFRPPDWQAHFETVETWLHTLG